MLELQLREHLLMSGLQTTPDLPASVFDESHPARVTPASMNN